MLLQVLAKKTKEHITIPDIPQFGIEEIVNFKFAYEGGATKSG